MQFIFTVLFFFHPNIIRRKLQNLLQHQLLGSHGGCSWGSIIHDYVSPSYDLNEDSQPQLAIFQFSLPYKVVYCLINIIPSPEETEIQCFHIHVFCCIN